MACCIDRCMCTCYECHIGRHCGYNDSHLSEQLYRQNRMLTEENWHLRRSLERACQSRYISMDFYGGLSLPEPEQSMGNKLSILAKKVFDKDFRALIKAGILDDSLEVTRDGANFLLSDYLAKNKTRLAADARKKIEEEEE